MLGVNYLKEVIARFTGKPAYYPTGQALNGAGVCHTGKTGSPPPAARFEEAYSATGGMLNLTAVIAGKLANLTAADATIAVEGDSPRAILLAETIGRCARDMKQILGRALGTGGVVLKPYTVDGKIYVETIPQSRFFITGRRGEVIRQAVFAAGAFEHGLDEFVRLEFHTLDNGLYTIEQRAVKNNREIPLESVPEWAGLNQKITLQGVENMLFGFLKCPAGNRNGADSIYGVPVTYGQDRLMKSITELIEQFDEEFRKKRVFVGVDEQLFDGKGRLPDNDMFVTFDSDTDGFFEVYSPDIRAQSYIDGINCRLGLLEKAVGVNRGVLTDLQTSDATATAIKRGTFDTFSLVDSVRSAVETALEQLVYACDVIARVNRLTPPGRYGLVFDWPYTLIEDDAEAWKQLMDAASIGAASADDLRNWLFDRRSETKAKALPQSPAEVVKGAKAPLFGGDEAGFIPAQGGR